MRASLSVHDLHFGWPDGTVVFDGLDLTAGPGRHGLVGRNGCGKSTLLRLIAGEITPHRGDVTVDGDLAYLPQDPGVDPRLTAAEVLGIDGILAAVRRVESGSVDSEDFDTIGDDWDVAERTSAHLAELGLGHIGVDRQVGSVSGGELVLLALAARLLARPSILLLDEPTNNLDGEARDRLIDLVVSWKGTLLVVSHDRDLLDRMDSMGDLRDGAVTWYGGTYADYEAALAIEQEAAGRAVRAAESELRTQQRELVQSQTTLARRRKYGQKMNDQKREPKIVMGNRKRSAEVSAGKLRGLREERLDEARSRLSDAEALVRDDREIRIDLPETSVPETRSVLTLESLRPVHGDLVVDLDLRGPERIGLTGRNGVGKTSLLRTIAGSLEPASGSVRRHVPIRHLPQRLDLLEPDLSVAQNVARIAPSANENQVRAQLARFLFRGRMADQPARTLSGGERLRATLACLLLAEPAPQLLLLDEPTNNLDLASVRHLVEALKSYRGACLVVSHDRRFLDDLDLTRRIDLG